MPVTTNANIERVRRRDGPDAATQNRRVWHFRVVDGRLCRVVRFVEIPPSLGEHSEWADASLGGFERWQAEHGFGEGDV